MNQPRDPLATAFDLHQAGRFQEAIELYNQILPSQQDNAQLLYLLGTANLQTARREQGIEQLRRSLALSPQNPAAHNNIGVALKELKRLEEALANFDEALALAPDFADAYNNRGDVLRDLNRTDEALASLDKALALNPGHAGAYNNRGNVLRDLKRLQDAIASYDGALAFKPDNASAHNNRGVALRDLMRTDEALASFDKALAISPNYAAAYNNRGVVLQELRRPHEALVSFDNALAISPDYAEAYANRGNVLRDLKRLDEALTSYNAALAINSNYADAYRNKSLLLLLTGKYSEGWSLYEWRLKSNDAGANYRNFPKLAWRGSEDIRGKKLLIQAEQGLGDVIQFCRYLPQLHALGADLIVEVPESLLTLISTLDCPMGLVAKGARLPEFDAYCPMMSLPYVFRTAVSTVPARIPYLFSDPNKVGRWQKKLGNKTGSRIGITWSGAEKHNNDQSRSISLDEFLPLTELPNFEWHSLQKEYRKPDFEILKRRPAIRQHQHELVDFSDTAALIEYMDLVITVDTSIAHLTGAMAKPTWILIPFCPDWRWMLDRKDTPWYPTATLYRQSQIGDWRGVVDAVRWDLSQLTGN